MAEQSEGGHEGAGGKVKAFLKKPIVWVALGAIALFFIVRARMSAGGSSPSASSPKSFGGGGGGGGYTGGGEGGGVASGIQAQLDQLDLQQAQERLRQSAALFNFNLQEKQNEAGVVDSIKQSWGALQSQGFQNLLDVAKTGKLPKGKGVIPMSCPHGDVVQDPYTGLPTCRVPEGGGFKPFQQIGQIISGNLQGLQNLNQEMWQGAAQAAPSIVQGALYDYTGYGGITGGGASQRIGKKSSGSNRTEQGMSGSVTGVNGGQFRIPSFWDTGEA